MERIYDYIIIGSGSAGSALAYRLGADGKRRILVLEFGGSDAGPLIQMPAALSYPMNMKRYDWGYLAEPEPALAGRRLVCHTGGFLRARTRVCTGRLEPADWWGPSTGLLLKRPIFCGLGFHPSHGCDTTHA